MELKKASNNYIIRSRSDFQIEHFVIGVHDTPEMQYRQVLIEAQDLIFKIEMAKLHEKKAMIEIKRLMDSNDEIDKIEAEEKRLGLAMTQAVLEGAKLELDALERIFQALPKFTSEQIEKNQPEYWQKRLKRQAEVDIVAAREGISAGNVQSLVNIGMYEEMKEVE